jgi:DNA-binding GntR family transcriptional regulator
MSEEQSEHEEIVAALENHDCETLVKALRKHIYRAKGSLVATLREK